MRKLTPAFPPSRTSREKTGSVYSKAIVMEQWSATRMNSERIWECDQAKRAASNRLDPMLAPFWRPPEDLVRTIRIPMTPKR
jgi:hypothetical protein